MTPLRQRMIEDLQLHGMSDCTQEAYVRAVRQLADYYHKSPDLITEEERIFPLHEKRQTLLSCRDHHRVVRH